MAFFTASVPYRQVEVEGRIIRADGTVEELGRIAYWHINPLRRLAWRLKQLVRGRKPGRITHH